MDKSLCERLYQAYGWTPGDLWVIEPDNFERAVEAYQDYCEATGAIFQQPARVDSEEKRGVVYLRNTNGPVARYSVRQEKILGGDSDD
jgi:hypothetical protein